MPSLTCSATWNGDEHGRLARANRCEPAVALDEVTFSFDSGAPVLRSLTLGVHPGSITSLLGPSGCGKSTVLNMVAGLIRPDCGSVLIDGEPLAGVNTRVGYMTQHDTLLPWRTVSSNVALPLKLRRRTGQPALRPEAIKEKVRETLDRVNLHGVDDKYPAQLSGGMRRRALLARSIVTDPTMILMDEPFGALDAQLASEIRQDFRSMVEARGQTVLFVTHDIDESAAISDSVIVLGLPEGHVVGMVDVPFGGRRNLEEVRGSADYAGVRNSLSKLVYEARRLEKE